MITAIAGKETVNMGNDVLLCSEFHPALYKCRRIRAQVYLVAFGITG